MQTRIVMFTSVFSSVCSYT